MRLALAAVGCCAGLLGACSPTAPEGVEKAALDQAVSDAVGDPGTCVLIAKDGKLVYRYGTHVVCGRKLPACDEPVLQTVGQLLERAPASGKPKTASCRSNADGSRLVAWASGPIEGRGMVYAAVMEGDLVPPGIVIADKLNAAFARAGLGPK